MRVIDSTHLELIKTALKVGYSFVTHDGVSRIKNITADGVITDDNEGNEKLYTFIEIIPILKGFKHLNYKDIYNIADIISNNNEFNKYKLNLNFLPHFFEITEESKDIKIQIYHNFDIVYCDKLISNMGHAYYYLMSKGYDVYNLHKIGLAIIDSKVYA